MKKFFSTILLLAIVFSVLSATSVYAAAPVSDEAELSREATINQVRSCLFPADGKKDIGTAIELLLPLVEDGDAEAQYYYAWIYDYALGEDDETEKESLYWYELSMEQGYLKSYLGVAMNGFVESEDLAKQLAKEAIALGLLSISDEELGPDGLFHLAHLYRDGIGVEASNRKMYEYFLKAAEMNYPLAANALAYYCYFEGHGVERNYEKALEWYTKAADLGFPVAMTNIGYMYRNGIGVERDSELALEWFFKAAELGDPTAMSHIGDMYYIGEGLACDHTKAMEWLSHSADAGLASSMHYKGWLLDMRDFDPQRKQNDTAMDCYIDSYLNGFDDALNSINAMLEKGSGVDAYLQRYGELLLAESN